LSIIIRNKLEKLITKHILKITKLPTPALQEAEAGSRRVCLSPNAVQTLCKVVSFGLPQPLEAWMGPWTDHCTRLGNPDPRRQMAKAGPELEEVSMLYNVPNKSTMSARFLG
jgi:hypothetical protein